MLKKEDYKNIFQIWKENEEKVPFAVRRWNWYENYYAVIERVEITKFPYGKAYGFAVANGKYSNHYDSKWNKKYPISCSGCYQWKLVKNVELDRNKLI